MSSIIQVSNLTLLHQNRAIIDDLTFSVEEGDIFGFMGPNGAGKSATIRVLATLLAPTQGDILIDGYSVKSAPEKVRGLIGYVPDQYGVYPDMTTREYLDFFGACYRLHLTERRELIPALLELVDLSEQKDMMTENLSLGMRQRLSLARALLHDPKVLILDNPLSGLDPSSRKEHLNLLSELTELGKTIFFSSSNFSNMSGMCNRIGIIDMGKLVAYGSVRELVNQLNLTKTIRIKIFGQAENAQSILQKSPFVIDIIVDNARTNDSYSTIEVNFHGDDKNAIELLAALVQSGVQIMDFDTEINEMETIYIHATRGL